MPTQTERAAFDLEQIRSMADLSCSHDRAWIEAWLTYQRRLTVEAIRDRLHLRKAAGLSAYSQESVESALDGEWAFGNSALIRKDRAPV